MFDVIIYRLCLLCWGFEINNVLFILEVNYRGYVIEILFIYCII